MHIQSGFDSLVYPGPKVSGVKLANASAQHAAPSEGARAPVPTDKVTISDAARAMAAKESGATQARTPIQEKMLADAASGGPEFAARMAEEMGTLPSTIFYNVRDTKGWEPLTKLSSTGRHIDEAFKERMSIEMAAVDAQRLALYNAEKAKGTNPVDIIAKMIDFTNAQSRDYLEASGWIAR